MQAIAQSHPHATLTVLTFAPGGDLLHYHPLIHRVIQIPKGTARHAVQVLTHNSSFDLIITDTTYDGIADLVQQSGVPHVVTNLWRNPPDHQKVSDRFLQLLHEDGWITPEALNMNQHPRIYLTPAEHAAAQARLGDLPHPRIGLYSDAGMAIKRWPTENFITLAHVLQQEHQASIIVPEGSDTASIQAITAKIPTAKPWPKGTLRELAALFAQLDAVVAADTGPARIAAALGIPTVTLFGPSWGDRYGQPLPHQNLQGYPSCPERYIPNFTTQSCWYSGQCPFEWRTCVDDISPEAVLTALIPMISAGLEGRELPEQEGKGINQRLEGIRLGSKTGSFPSLLPSFASAQNILAIRLDNIGDVIMTGPALKALKANASTQLTLLASPAGAQAAAVLPWVDDVIAWRSLWQDLGRLPFDPDREWQLIEQLRARQFDAAAIFTSFKQSPHPAALICQMAGIPVRLGFSREEDVVLTHTASAPPDEEHQAERNMHLVEFVGYSVHDRSLQLQIPACSLIPDEPYLLLNPWASCPSRTYDLERFGKAAALLSEQTGYRVVVTGLEKDRDRARPLLEIVGDRAIDYMGQTNFTDLVALVAHARLMLSNNTSTMHIADATRTPSVILFAGTELERQWRPRSTRAVLLRCPTSCSPCYQFTCPYELECLDITPEAIAVAGLSLLQEARLCV
ncbi:glycosyltransferase family 9 protein [Leptolyngbya sp. FACHB-16]|nr:MULTISPECIES: glycosyltransferase family 9 protein [unclassified Leptolyngbya]MBD1909202.1 glycosyltransferase family 9 protein [Leptolyngbya sp. FACHB-8]MBD2153995.1 glycosyltransferase family 9 protein [Leptolyngbya sp. FACHB-16]